MTPVPGKSQEDGFTPGPWFVDAKALGIWCNSAKGGHTKIFDVRGWGYLTGQGHGALGLDAETATKIQHANAAVAAAAPDLLEALETLEAFYERKNEDSFDHFERIADWFYKETGYLRPGKDCFLHEREVREAAWTKWRAEKLAKARAAIAKARKVSP